MYYKYTTCTTLSKKQQPSSHKIFFNHHLRDLNHNMGICISSASSKIQEDQDYGQENVMFFQEKFQFYGSVDQGLASLHSKAGTKGLNQDSAILYQGYGMQDGALYAVFDGHGPNGHIVSKMVRNRLPSLLLAQRNALTKVVDDFQGWREACTSAFKVVDKEIKLQENLDCSCSGTTAVVVIKQGGGLVIANLGDSRAVLGTVSEDGGLEAVQLTTDLKPSVASEAERIRNCNGRVMALRDEPHIQRVWLPHEDAPGLAMSRAFGDFVLKNHGVTAIPEVSYRRLNPKDQFLVLATDGVWDVLSNEQVASIVWSAESEQEGARAVVEEATEAWKQKFPGSKVDDITVVCLFLQKKKQIDLGG